MGTSIGYICGRCGQRFHARSGGGFSFDLLHCDQCGAAHSVLHADMGDAHLGFVKGLPGPYAVVRAAVDAEIKRTYPGEPLSRDEYHAAVESQLEPCACGGSYRYAAPPRCPTCRSTPDAWTEDPNAPRMLYD